VGSKPVVIGEDGAHVAQELHSEYHAPWFYAHSIVRGGIDKVHVGLEIAPVG
jgi:hypothetical protein